MIRQTIFLFFLIHLALANKHRGGRGHHAQVPPPPTQKWLTLSGESPLVIARGGFPGFYPDSSDSGYRSAITESLADAVMYCELQMTKDGVGICIGTIRLDNTTNIADLFPKGKKTYDINGESVEGWFAVDYPMKIVYNNVTLRQSNYNRPFIFDNMIAVLAVEDVIGFNPTYFWLNVEYDMFYKQHNVNVGEYIQTGPASDKIDYISSPEIGFLKSLKGKLPNPKTKLVFKFQSGNKTEPTTKKTYSSLLQDLASVKTFASGILVPKEYIWPINSDRYLQTPTGLVSDAHKLGLQVYTYGFGNDMPGSYNYSLDPISEYLGFVDNSNFSVDGVITDFPQTASEAIACFPKNLMLDKNRHGQGTFLVISHDGASGVYPGSTDLAYQRAVDDGTDIIDCSVQMTKDGVAFCLSSVDITQGTNAMATFMSRAKTIPEIQPQNGIFSFDFSWSEIQSLKPQIYVSQNHNKDALRNPASKNSGKFITLADFLEFAKAKAVMGILINIKNAAYLASNCGLDIIKAVDSALKNATFDKQQVTQRVLIQSDDTSVLSKFKNIPRYERVLELSDKEHLISDAPKKAVEEIKEYATSVVVNKQSIIPTSQSLTKVATSIVNEMHAANITVYGSGFSNEFFTIALDLYSDIYLEMSTFIWTAYLDGLITDYPYSPNAFRRSPCYLPDAKVPYPIQGPWGGDFMNSDYYHTLAQPPAAAPAPSLDPADVVDPPLPPVKVQTSEIESSPPAAAPAKAAAPSESGEPKNVANAGLCLLTMLVLSFLSLGY